MTRASPQTPSPCSLFCITSSVHPMMSFCSPWGFSLHPHGNVSIVPAQPHKLRRQVGFVKLEKGTDLGEQDLPWSCQDILTWGHIFVGMG